MRMVRERPIGDVKTSFKDRNQQQVMLCPAKPRRRYFFSSVFIGHPSCFNFIVVESEVDVSSDD